MAAGTRQTNTMEELLRKMLGQVSELKLSDDPDWEFITGLETGILSKLRQPIDQVAQQGLTAVPPGISQGGGMGGPPMGGMAPPMAPAQMGGLDASSQLPNPDELRRILSQGQM